MPGPDRAAPAHRQRTDSGAPSGLAVQVRLRNEDLNSSSQQLRLADDSTGQNRSLIASPTALAASPMSFATSFALSPTHSPASPTPSTTSDAPSEMPSPMAPTLMENPKS